MKIEKCKYPPCLNLVTDELNDLGFQVVERFYDCFTLIHPNGIRCLVPNKILESYPEVEQKTKAVLGFYIEQCCK